MRITLTYDEVREALAKAIEEKTSGQHGEVDSDLCFFTVSSISGEVDDVEEVTFTWCES